MTSQLDRVPEIDYEAHPAFAGLRAADETANARAEALILEIDTAYASAQSADTPQEAFDHTVAPLIGKLNALAHEQAIPISFAPFLVKALEIARSTLRQNLIARGQARSNSDTQSLSEELRAGLASFRKDGFYATATPKLARRVWRGTWIERAILRASAAREPNRHAAVALHPASPTVRAIRQAVRDSGLETFVSAYLGKPVSLYYASLDYAHPAQTWFKGCYASEGIADSKTVYMHFDADTDIIKGLFYLNDVTEKDGPFRFVRGSHLWQRSPVQMAVRKGFDEASTTTFPMTESSLDFLQGYYRPRFQTADYKAGMLALPRALRGSTHFGDDVVNDTPLSDTLLQEEHSFAGPAGTLVIFDGSRGIHRGSLTSTGGERWAVQLAFKVSSETTPNVNQDKVTLRQRLSYLKHAVINLLRLAKGGA